LRWNPVPNATQYHVRVGDLAAGMGQMVTNTFINIDDIPQDFHPNQPFQFTVFAAADGFADSPSVSITWIATASIQQLQAPTGLRVDANAILRWNPVPGANHYEFLVQGVPWGDTIFDNWDLGLSISLKNPPPLPGQVVHVEMFAVAPDLTTRSPSATISWTVPGAAPTPTPAPTPQATPIATPIPMATPAPTPTTTQAELPPYQPSPWATEPVNTAISHGLVPTLLQSLYTQPTTRAEFAAFAVALHETYTGVEIPYRIPFNDTDDLNVQKMGGLGVVLGVGDGYFNPDDTLTREQAAVMLARLSDVLGHTLPQSNADFADNISISPWAIDAVGRIQAASIMHGVGDNVFYPGGAYTREQSIVTILRLFDRMQ